MSAMHPDLIDDGVVCDTCGRECNRINLDWHVTDSGMFQAALLPGPQGDFIGTVFIHPMPTLWQTEFLFRDGTRWKSPFRYGDARDCIHAAEHLVRTIDDIRRSAR